MKSASRFAGSSRALHWLMAAMVLSMLLVGMTMVTSLTGYDWLISIHRPLGIAILVTVVVRFVNRQLKPPPPFPETMSRMERIAASGSEKLLYALMFVLPLVGWGMLSAAGYPVVLFGPVHLPPLLPHSTRLYVFLRETHTILAYLLFLTFMGHLSAVLFHTLVVRDGLLRRMAPWVTGAREPTAASRAGGGE